MLDINEYLSTVILIPSNMMFKTSNWWSLGRQRAARPMLIEARQRSRHRVRHARVGPQRAEHGPHRQQRGRQPLGDGTCFLRDVSQFCRDRIAHIDVLAVLGKEECLARIGDQTARRPRDAGIAAR